MSIKSLLSRMFLSVVAVVFVASNAMAQGTILVVDTEKVITDSTVGKHVLSQLKSIQASMESEIKAKASPLEAKSKSFGAQYDGKSMESLKNDAGFKQQYTSLQKDSANLQREAVYIQQELAQTRAKALTAVYTKLQTIIDQVAKERGADVVLEKKLVLYGAPADVTSTVLSRLNSQMTSTPVSRVRLPRTQ